MNLVISNRISVRIMRTLRIVGVFSAWSVLAVVSSAFAETSATRRNEQKQTPNLAVSALFAPARFVVQDPRHRDRLGAFLREYAGDSSGAYTLKGREFRLSRRLVAQLALENATEGIDAGSETEQESGRRRRARLRLERALGAVGTSMGQSAVEEVGLAFPAGYLPGEASYIHAATAAEESNAACRQKPVWPYRNVSASCGYAVGVDINMARVWERFEGADTLVIAVLDAGFDFLHHDLQNRWAVNLAEANGVAGVDDDGNGLVDDVRGWDFVDDDSDAQDYNGHGTMTSGVIAAGFDNGIGIPGMLPRVKILPVRVLSTAGFGSTADIAAGIHYAARRGAHVINFSIGINSSATDNTLRNAFIAARDSGVIVVAASGNSALDLDANPRAPSSYGFENVYMVGSHNQAAGHSGFSNYGATKVDLAAPGDQIVTSAIPPELTLTTQNFEAFVDSQWSFTGTWQAAPDSLEGTKSLRWVSGNTATATLKNLDLRGKRGGLLSFRLNLKPTNSRDGVDLFYARGSDTVNLGGWGGSSLDETIEVNLGAVDNSAFQLVFRACVLNTLGTACSGSASASGRVLRIDDLKITHADLDPAHHTGTAITGGTSLAAPYVAGYAGLMRLATDRMGVPLTRARMLAGVKVEPALAGKVATSGRLDVAKGLDFYLRTLPVITVSDTLMTSWSTGAQVGYTLGVADSTGPRSGFTFSPIVLPAGSTLSQSGLFAWSSGPAIQGEYALRAKAESGSQTLRTLMTFSLVAATPIRVANRNEASRLRIGGRTFLLPPGTFTGARTENVLRIELYGADGKILRRLNGPLTLPAGSSGSTDPQNARLAEYALTGFQGVGIRAWLNGVALRSATPD